MEEPEETDDQKLQVLEESLYEQLQHEEDSERMQLLLTVLSTVQKMRLEMPNSQSDEFQMLLQQLEDLNSP